MTPLPAWGDPARVRGRGQTAAAGIMARRRLRADGRSGRWGALRERLDPLELVRKELHQGAGGVVPVARPLALDVTPTARNGTRGNHHKHTRRRPAAVRAMTLWM